MITNLMTEPALRAWAMDRSVPAPIQDWAIILSVQTELYAVFLALASDVVCPRRDFFLKVLYLAFAQEIQSRLHSIISPELEAAIKAGAISARAEVRSWSLAATLVLADRGSFHFKKWMEKSSRQSGA